MPTSAFGAVLFALLFFPGFCYVAARERARPGSESKHFRPSAFRETVKVVFASAVSILLALLVFGLVRVLLPGSTPDVGQLVTNGQTYYLHHYLSTTYWALGIIAAACLLAMLAGHHRFPGEAWWLPAPKDISEHSSWQSIFEFEDARDRTKVLVCHLADGTRIEGPLVSYNPSPDEDDERDIVLRTPLFVQRPGLAEERIDLGAVVISAGQLSWFAVDYLTDEEEARRAGRRLRSPSGAKDRAPRLIR